MVDGAEQQMPDVKVAVVGAGSFVFGPSVLKDAILENRLNGLELALLDVDRETVQLMAGVGRRMAREAGVKAKVTAHTQRAKAFDGADFVVCSAARQIFKRFQMDCEIIGRLAPGHLITEFGGVAGISYSLRQMALIQELAADIRKLCPKAWLFNVSNPLPRVAQAAHEAGVRTVGFCSVSIGCYGMLWRIFGGEAIKYPFARGRETWTALMAGLNHFSWLLELRGRESGVDAMPDLRRRLSCGATSGQTRCEKYCRRTGYLLTAGDNHVRDFLAPEPGAHQLREASHGTAAERERRLKLLRDVAAGKAPWDDLTAHESWEKPLDLVAAMAFGRPAEFSALNLINDGQIPSLPRNVFVETPCSVSARGPVPRKIVLPRGIRPLCLRTAQVTAAIVRAGAARRRKLVHHAVELDPTVIDKKAGCTAIDECLKAHADVLPAYE